MKFSRKENFKILSNAPLTDSVCTTTSLPNEIQTRVKFMRILLD